MKVPLTAALLLVLASCTNQQKTDSLNMPGAYKMLSQSVKGGKTDTSYTDIQQQKMYSDDYMMYASFKPADSACSFGIGTYTSNKDTLTEHVFYNAADSSQSEKPHHYKLLIEKTANGYKQVIPEIESNGIKFVLTETYETVTTAVTSPLDGTWKLEKQLYIKGKDTVVNKVTQFKMYHAGHFIWGHTWADSTNKLHTGVGYGTFVLTGTDKLKETVAVSTYYDVRGKEVAVDVMLSGSDAFAQTIMNPDSSKQVETYSRLKK